MREFCTQHSIPSPAYCKCKTIEEAKDFFKSINARCILKPLNANSSKGVFVINKEEDIDRYWGDSMSYSKSSGTLLIEQYVDGIEFTIDGLVTSRGHVSLAISEKRHYEYNPSIAFELFFSNYNEKFDYDALRKINDYYVDSSSLPIGYLTHAEYKYMDGQFYLIEIAARGGGNYISSDIVPLMSGVDNYSYMIDSLVEHRTDLEVCIDETLRDRCAVLYFFDVPFEGVVKEIKGLEILSNNPNVVRFELHFKVGDTIQRAKNDSARVGYYIAYADNKQALRLLMKKINDTLKIIVE
jgi:biotin carboxylase